MCYIYIIFLTGRNPTETFSLNFRNRIISPEDSVWQDLNKLVWFYTSIHCVNICREFAI